MPRKKEGPRETKFTCPNSSCGLVFSKPVKVKNLGCEDSECYDACPRCLTAVTLEESVAVVEAKPGALVEDSKEKEIVNDAEERKAKPLTAMHCAYHVGYLSERSRNEKIPEECMVCENIVKCMLKVVKG
jgi:hypothetical protein